MWLPTLLALLAPQSADLPRVIVGPEGHTVTESCRLVLPDEPVRPGALQILGGGAGRVRVEFEGELIGSRAGVSPDAYAGTGLFVTGADVTLVAPRVRGFKVAIEALDAPGLQIVDADVSDNFRQRLGSTWDREDPRDWLAPHENGRGQWKRAYGAGLVVERSSGVRIQGLVARDVQNGVILDQVTDSVVTRSDASFLSGWGCALWRSCNNEISWNRFEFCVRGYSHGRYNRGQDSAGLLMFEQCSDNLVHSNSLTHSGDGIFGFAGRAALGQRQYRPETYAPGLGCNGNEFAWNDLSFAAAHGLELTFSFDNTIHHNAFVENAICGLWLGYGRDSRIWGNLFARNGNAGYGAERGAINAEHAQRLLIRDNRFDGNAVGIRIWTDEDPLIQDTPWAALNGVGAADNALYPPLEGSPWPTIELVDAARSWVPLPEGDPGLSIDPSSAASRRTDEPEPADGRPSSAVIDRAAALPAPTDRPAVRGRIDRGFHGLAEGDRLPLERERDAIPLGRQAIVLTDWGPCDWSYPFVQPIERSGTRHTYRLLGPDSLTSVATIEGQGEIDVVFDKALPDFPTGPDGLAQGVVAVTPRAAGRATPYALIVRARGNDLPVSGVLLELDWEVRWFASEVDPRADRGAWLASAATPVARTSLPSLDLDYGHRGPAPLVREFDPQAASALEALGGDHFGTLARAVVTLPAGSWRIRSRSDDGIRVAVDGELVIDEWTWHAPQDDQALLVLPEEREVELVVEHFELDGYALLEVTLEPAD